MELSREELKEMMTIFKVESEEHLNNLTNLLLQLEKDPANKHLLEEIFRTAHSMKGAARMMGFTSIEKIAHELENIFGLLRKGQSTLDTDDFDRVYEGIDIISQIVEKMSVDGTEAGIDITGTITKLAAAYSQKEAAAAGVKPAGAKQTKPRKVSKAKKAKKGSTTPTDAADSKSKPGVDAEEITEVEQSVQTAEEAIAVARAVSSLEDTVVRVSTHHLDELMNQVSELFTSKIKSDQLLTDTGKLFDGVDSFYHDLERKRILLTRLSSKLDAIREMTGNGYDSDWNYEVVTLLQLFSSDSQRISALRSAVELLYERQNEDNLRNEIIVGDIQKSLSTIRMLPLSTIFDHFPRMIRDIAKSQKKRVNLVINGGSRRVDKKIIQELKDPLIHLLRNSVDHGIETRDDRRAAGKSDEGRIELDAEYSGNMVVIRIEDDGRGIDTEKIAQSAVQKGYIDEGYVRKVSEKELINLIFHSGFSTAKIITDLSGRGVGLDVVKANIEKIKGSIGVSTTKGTGTRFEIKIPLTLVTSHVLIFEVEDTRYSIPFSAIDRTVRFTEEEIRKTGNRDMILVNDNPIPLFRLASVLENPAQKLIELGIKQKPVSRIELSKEVDEKIYYNAIVLNITGNQAAFLVDRLVDEQEVVVKSLGRQLKRVRNVAGVTMLGDGSLSIILNPSDMIKSVQLDTSRFLLKRKTRADREKPKILVVDDSITTRTLEKNILESAGYDVTIATDGLQAYDKLMGSRFDLIVSDVEMPNMTGFQFAEKVRGTPSVQEIPFILVTSLESEEDKRRGIEVGANAYIVKGAFDQKNLLETIERLI